MAFTRKNLKRGDLVKMYCNWCDKSLWFEIAGFSKDGESDGFTYFHPLIGEWAGWYLSAIEEVKPGIRGELKLYTTVEDFNRNSAEGEKNE